MGSRFSLVLLGGDFILGIDHSSHGFASILHRSLCAYSCLCLPLLPLKMVLKLYPIMIIRMAMRR